MLSERVKEWTEQWKAEGFQQGMEKGMRQGAQEGKAVFLIRLLEKKFGPLGLRTLARIKAAEPEQLLAWGERVLGARELGGVFGDAE